jgi:hypothetical protein
MLVGNSGAIYSSTDGLTWTNRTIGAGQTLGNVTYNSGVWSAFILISAAGGYFKSVDNGVTWLRTAFPDASVASRVNYIGGKYIKLAPSYISSSSDGVTWRAIDQVTYRTTTIDSLQKVNNKYFAIAYSGTYPLVWSSSDGITFTPSRTAVRGYVAYTGSAYINVFWGALGPVGVYRSTDGDTWTHYSDVGTDASSTRVFNMNVLTDTLYASGKLTFFTAAAATSTALNTQTVYYSSDGGTTWLAGNAPAGQAMSFVGATDGTTIVNVAAAPFGVYKTTDGGASWTPIYGVSGGTSPTYTGGYWYFTSNHTSDASAIFAGPSLTITSLGTYNGYGFNLTNAQAQIWKTGDNQIAGVFRQSFSIPGSLAISPNAKEAPIRTSDNRVLTLGNFNSTAATVVNSIVEWPLFSYNTTTTFFVPQQVTGLASNEYIYAGA